MDKRSNLIQERSFQFSICILRYAKSLRNQHEYEVASQLIRSGTSIGANVEEALGAQSRRDFISKLAIARKEARETNYWLRLLAEYISFSAELHFLLEEIDHILAILTAIIKTTLAE